MSGDLHLSRLAIVDSQGRERIELSTGEDDSPEILLYDQQGDEQAEITSHGIRLFDQDGTAHLVLTGDRPARSL